MSQIKKAIIPAAGLGTRFLPATKTVPKEMLTIVDAPIILYVVEEAVRAGIQDIVLIAGRGKHAIEDFFDTSYELEDRLAREGKIHLLERVTSLRTKANIISIRQKQALGLGHAILTGLPIIGKEPFAVLLGDEITQGLENEPTVTEQLVKSFEKTGASTVSVMKVTDKEVNKYGIAEPQVEDSNYFKVKNFIEKPKPSETTSRWALPGRYVFTNEIMTLLERAKPTLNGEIQLTDSMKELCQKQDFYAMTFTAQRYDTGDKLGFLKANIEIGLKHPNLKDEFQQYLIQLTDKIKRLQ